MVEEERKGFLITDVKSCTEGFNPKWSNTLVYEVQTEQGDRLFLEMTIDVVKKFRTMPERHRRGSEDLEYGNSVTATAADRPTISD
jgi:urocanate hydratase